MWRRDRAWVFVGRVTMWIDHGISARHKGRRGRQPTLESGGVARES